MNDKCLKAGMLMVLPLLMIFIPLRGTVVGKEKGSKPAVAQGSTGNVQKPAAGIDVPEYVIGAEDVLDINVWKEPELSRAVPVRPDGKISLPLLNDVQAVGLTPTQLAAVITERLKKFITRPQVTVVVSTINSRRVYVVGEVNRGGSFLLMPNMTVLQALANAGGLTPFANRKDIYVLRNEDAKQVRYPFNYKEALRGKDGQQNIVLKPGDTIVVP